MTAQDARDARLCLFIPLLRDAKDKVRGADAVAWEGKSDISAPRATYAKMSPRGMLPCVTAHTAGCAMTPVTARVSPRSP